MAGAIIIPRKRLHALSYGVVPDLNSPFNAGIKNLWSPLVGSFRRDYFNRLNVADSTTALSLISSSVGAAVLSNGVGDVALTPIPFTMPDQYHCLVVARIDTDVNGQTISLSGNAYNDGGYTFGRWSGGTWFSADGAGFVTCTPTYTVGQWAVFQYQFVKGSTPAMWVGTQRTAFSGALNSNQVIRFLCGINGFSFSGAIALSVVWYGIKSDAEIGELGANPCQLFKPINRRIHFGGVAAGGTTITPAAGSLNFTGVTSTLNLTMTPAVGTLTLGGLQPTVSQGTILTPSVGTLTLNGLASTMNFGMTPTQGTLTFNGYAPTVSASGAVNITPAVGSLTINGLAPSMNLGLTTGVGALTIAGLQPSISLNTDRTPAAGTLTFAGLQPSITVTTSTAVGDTGILALTGYAPIIVNTTPVVSSVQPTGGWRIRKPGEYYFGEVRLPTPEEVQAQREKLGILPRTMRKAIDRIVERELASAASDEEATKAVFDQYKSGELRQRLRSDVPREAGVRPTRSSKGLAPILEVMILDGLRQRAFADQQNAMIQAMMAEEDEIKQVLSLWLQL